MSSVTRPLQSKYFMCKQNLIFFFLMSKLLEPLYLDQRSRTSWFFNLWRSSSLLRLDGQSNGNRNDGTSLSLRRMYLSSANRFDIFLSFHFTKKISCSSVSTARQCTYSNLKLTSHALCFEGGLLSNPILTGPHFAFIQSQCNSRFRELTVIEQLSVQFPTLNTMLPYTMLIPFP